MKMMLKRLLSVLVTAMMLVSLVPAAAFAGSGPKMFTGDYSDPDSGFAYIRFGETTIFGIDYNTNENVSPADGHYVYEPSGGNGFIKYDPDTNTIYMGGINEPGKVLDINMMGEDLSLFIEDENTIAGITVWGDAWGGSLKITTGMSGKLTAVQRGIRIEGENSNSVLTVEQGVTLDLTNSYNDFGAVSVAGTSAASGGIVINGTLAQVDGQTPEIIRTVVPTEVGHYDAATEQWISEGTIDLYTYALGKGENPFGHILISSEGGNISDVKTAPTITTASIDGGFIGLAYQNTLQATKGSSDEEIKWQLASGSLPQGIELTQGGYIMGTAAETGSFTFSVMAYQEQGVYSTASFTLNIFEQPPLITTESLDGGKVGQAYSQTLAATKADGSEGTITWSLPEGGLPPGLELNTGTGVISGTPESAGVFSFKVRAVLTGEYGNYNEKDFSIVIANKDLQVEGEAYLYLSETEYGTLLRERDYSVYLPLNRALDEGESCSITMNYTDAGETQRTVDVGTDVYYNAAYGNGSLPADAAFIDSFVFDVNGTEVTVPVGKSVAPRLKLSFSGSTDWAYYPDVQISDAQNNVIFSDNLYYYSNASELVLDRLKAGSYTLDIIGYVDGHGYMSFLGTPVDITLTDGQISEKAVTFSPKSSEYVELRAKAGANYASANYYWYSDAAGTQPLATGSWYPVLVGETVYVKAVPAWGDSIYYSESALTPVTGTRPASGSSYRTVEIALNKKTVGTVSGKATADDPAGGPASALANTYIYLIRYGSNGYSQTEYVRTGADGSYSVSNVPAGSLLTASSGDLRYAAAERTISASDLGGTVNINMPLADGLVTFGDLTYDSEYGSHTTYAWNITKIVVTKADGTELAIRRKDSSFVLADPSQVSAGEVLDLDLYYNQDTGFWESELHTTFAFGTRSGKLYKKLQNLTMTQKGFVSFSWSGGNGLQGFDLLLYDAGGLIYKSSAARPNAWYNATSGWFSTPRLDAGNYSYAVVNSIYLNSLAPESYQSSWSGGTEYAAAGSFTISDKVRTNLSVSLPSAKADNGLVNLSASNISMTQRYEGLVDIELVCQLNKPQAPAGGVKLQIFTNQGGQTSLGSGFVNTRSLTINGKVFDLNRWTNNGIILSDGSITITLTEAELAEFGGFPLTVNTTVNETVSYELKAEAWITIGSDSYFVADCEAKSGLLSIYAPANSVDGVFTVYGFGPSSMRGPNTHNSDYTVNIFADGVQVAQTKTDGNRGLYRVKLALPQDFLEDHHKIEFVAAGQYADGACTYVSEPAYTVVSASDGALHAYWLEWQSHAGDPYQQMPVWDDGEPLGVYLSYYRGGGAGDKAQVRWRLQFDNPDNVSNVQVVVPRNGTEIAIDAKDQGGGIFLTDGYYFEGTAPDGAYVTYSTERYAGLDSIEPISADEYTKLKSAFESGTYISQMNGKPGDEHGMSFLMAVKSGGSDVMAVTWFEKNLAWDATDIADLEALAAEKKSDGRYENSPNLLYWNEGEVDVQIDSGTVKTWATDAIYKYTDNDNPGEYVYMREIHTIDTRVVTTWCTADRTKSQTTLVLGDGSGEYDEAEFADIDRSVYTDKQYDGLVAYHKTSAVQETWIGFFDVFAEALAEVFDRADASGNITLASSFSTRNLTAALTYQQVVNGYNAVKKVWNSDASKLARRSYKWAQGAPPTKKQLRRLKDFVDKNPCIKVVFDAYKGTSDSPYDIFGEFNAAYYKIGVGAIGKILGTATNSASYLEGSAAKAATKFGKAMADGAKTKFYDSRERELFGDQGKNLAREMYRAAMEIQQNEVHIQGALCDEGIKWEYWPTDVYDPESEFGDKITNNTEQHQSVKAGPQGRYDPSGFIYEAVPSNRIEDATVTLYTLDGVAETRNAQDLVTGISGGTRIMADSTWFGIEPNPQQSTSEEGRYQWFVPQGYWAVAASKDGYEAADTRSSSDFGLNALQHDDGWYMPVLPVQLDVNIPLVSYQAPEVSSVEANTEGVFIQFSKYMDEASLTASGAISLFVNETLTPFTISLVDHEKSSASADAPYYTSLLRLSYDGAAAYDKVQVVIANSVKSYAGTRMEERYDSGEKLVAVPQQVEAPAASPAAGTVEANTRVELSCATDGASIHYTADGSEPTSASALYSGSILISETTTIKAVAVKAGMTDSEVLTAVYTVSDPAAVVVAKVSATLNGAAVTDGSSLTEGYLKLETATEGAKIYYTTNGVCPKDDAENRIEYTGPIWLAAGTYFFRIRAFKDGVWSDGLPLRLTVNAAPASDGSGSGGSAENASGSAIEYDFTDVADSAWYAEAVDYVASKGYFYGVTETEFAPERTMTRAMFAAVIWRVAGEPAFSGGSDFEDVAAGRYYSTAVAWADHNEILLGIDGKFYPERAVTREQMAAILWRYSGRPEADEAVFDAFGDADEISAYARPAMAWAIEKGLIGGKGGGVLDPKGDAKRCEVAKIIMLFDGLGD